MKRERERERERVTQFSDLEGDWQMRAFDNRRLLHAFHSILAGKNDFTLERMGRRVVDCVSVGTLGRVVASDTRTTRV